jgi:hypothetical protein
MKVNAIGLLTNAAMQLKHRDGFIAYGLLEFANNLRQVMRGEATLDEFRAVYVGWDAEPIDIDALLPTPADA